MHDLLIKNAWIHDGTGAEARFGAVAVSRGRIVAVGETSGEAAETVDARGLALMPGIIDAHTHYDAQVTWDAGCDPSPALGVTTVVMGNCGFTLAPCRPEHRESLMRSFMRVEGMALDSLRAGIRWDFETFPQYLDMLQGRGVVPNVAVYLGHSALRLYVMGDEASRRAATDAEIAAMAGLVHEAIVAGAAGFSTSTHEQHIGDGGAPMPSRLADEVEHRELARAVGRAGRGMLMVVKGAGTSIADLEAVAAASGRPMLVSSMRHHVSAPGKVFDELEQIAAARARGHMLYGQCSCLPMCMDFTLLNPYPFEAFAHWRPAVEAADSQGAQALARVYADAGFREAMKEELRETSASRVFRGDWMKLCIGETALPAHGHLEGQSIGALAAAQGVHPFDCLLDLALSEDLRTVFTMEFSNYDTEAVGRILCQPDNQISLGDAGAHLSFLCEAGFGLDLLGRWVRELGVLSLPEAVRRLTSQPADLFGMPERGRLAPGMAADLLLFDPSTVAIGAKTRCFDLPAQATRIRTPAIGVEGVWVNGVQVADAGGPRPVRGRPPGTVLRRFEG